MRSHCFVCFNFIVFYIKGILLYRLKINHVCDLLLNNTWLNICQTIFLQRPVRPPQVRWISPVCATTAWPIRTSPLTPAVTTVWETPACLLMRKLAPWAGQVPSGMDLRKVRGDSCVGMFSLQFMGYVIRYNPFSRPACFPLYLQCLPSSQLLCLEIYYSFCLENIRTDYNYSSKKSTLSPWKSIISFGMALFFSLACLLRKSTQPRCSDSHADSLLSRDCATGVVLPTFPPCPGGFSWM